MPNAIPCAQIPDKSSIQTNPTSFGNSSVALNIASNSRNPHSLNAVSDTEHASSIEHVEIVREHQQVHVDPRTDSGRELGPSFGRQVTITDSIPPMPDNVSYQ